MDIHSSLPPWKYSVARGIGMGPKSPLEVFSVNVKVNNLKQ